MKIKAKLHVKYDTEIVSPTFKKRRFVVAYAENPMYPQFVEFQMLQDCVTDLDNYECGDNITVSFDIKGREWKSPSGEVKYFNSLDAWKLAYDNSTPFTAQPVTATSDPATPYVSPSDDSDLPF